MIWEPDDDFFIEDIAETEAVIPEMALWQEVLRNALMDALMIGNYSDHFVTPNQAFAWLSLRNRDFWMVCEFAGFCPKLVYAAFERAQGDLEFAEDMRRGLLSVARDYKELKDYGYYRKRGGVGAAPLSKKAITALRKQNKTGKKRKGSSQWLQKN